MIPPYYASVIFAAFIGIIIGFLAALKITEETAFNEQLDGVCSLAVLIAIIIFAVTLYAIVSGAASFYTHAPAV